MAHQYLVGGYMYYILNESMMEDYEYDHICRELYKNFDSLEYRYKHLIDKDNLKASTAYTLRAEDYPDHVKKSALYVLDIRSRRP